MITEKDIKEFYEFVDRLGLKFPGAEISRATGYGKSNVSQYLNKKLEPSEAFINAVYNAFKKGSKNVPQETMVAEDSPTMRHTKFRLSLKGKERLLPVSNGKAAAGTITFYNDEPNLIMDFIDAPFIGNVDGVVEVSGDSMYPTLKNGARIAITKLSDPTMVYWNEIYFVVDKNWQGVIKRIKPGDKEDFVYLVSDNDKYPPVKRNWNQIEAVFKIKADITKH